MLYDEGTVISDFTPDNIAIQLFNATATALNCISQICCFHVALISCLAIIGRFVRGTIHFLVRFGYSKAVRAVRTRYSMASTGYCPAAVSPVSITLEAPSATAL